MNKKLLPFSTYVSVVLHPSTVVYIIKSLLYKDEQGTLISMKQ